MFPGKYMSFVFIRFILLLLLESVSVLPRLLVLFVGDMAAEEEAAGSSFCRSGPLSESDSGAKLGR